MNLFAKAPSIGGDADGIAAEDATFNKRFSNTQSIIFSFVRILLYFANMHTSHRGFYFPEQHFILFAEWRARIATKMRDRFATIFHPSVCFSRVLRRDCERDGARLRESLGVPQPADRFFP